MSVYRKYLRNRNTSKGLYEDDEIIFEEPEIFIEDELYEIADNLGYTFMTPDPPERPEGLIAVSDITSIRIRYTEDKLMRIYVDINNNRDSQRGRIRFDCTTNTTSVDNLSNDLQTSIMIIKEIKQKLM